MLSRPTSVGAEEDRHVLGRSAVPAGPVCQGTHLGKTTAEARSPAALGAGGPTAQALAAQDAVTALRVGAPGQIGAAFHIASQKGLLVLWAEASIAAMDDGKTGGSEGSEHRKASLPSGSVGAGVYLGDDLWGGDNVTDEGSGGLGRTVSDGAGTVQHKVLFYPSCQVLVPARLPG